MRLHEEYILRHNLNVPVVRYDEHSQIILRSQEKPYNWRILSAYWRSGGYHPGYFEVSYKMPIRNGYHKGKMLGDVIRPRTVFWDSYEGCILDLVEKQRTDFKAVSADESAFAAWSIFLLIYDGWLSLNMPDKFFAAAAESLDEGLSSVDRMVCLCDAMRHIEGTELSEAYECQIKPWSDSHSDWLENLVNA